MSGYLDNPVCTFKPLFPTHPGWEKKKKDIVSSSLFRIKGGGYRSYSKYIDRVKNINYYATKIMKFKHRLFIDRSVYEDKESMKKLKKLDVELVLYECPDFLTEKGSKFHRGTFGMFVRYFPMFDFPNNDCRNLIVSDVDDVSVSAVDRTSVGGLFHFFEDLGFKMKHLDYIATTKFWRSGVYGPYIMSSRQLTKGNMDHRLLINFLKNPPQEALTDYAHGLNKLDGVTDFVYGTDEWFLNHVMMKDIVDRKLPYATKTKYSVLDIIIHAPPLLNLREGKIEPSVKEKKEFLRMYQYLVPEKNFKDLTDAHKYVTTKYDEMHKKKGLKSKEETNFILRIYEYLIYIQEKPEAEFYKKEAVDHALSMRYIGIYHYSEVKFFNTKYTDFFERKETLPRREINYLKTLMGYVKRDV